MEKDNKIFLEHILESIEAIEEFTKNVGEEEFYSNREKTDAVIRNFEIIGEASKFLNDDFKMVNAHIPWRDISDLRNVLIHEYFGVDKEKVWKMIEKDVPNLKNNIKKLLQK
jgi:uncharacterized protein with HEPN domain